MPKATSTPAGKSSARPRRSAGAQAASTERKAAKVVESARHEAAQIRAEAEEHARRLVLDARASADGVRAEGMEVVSNLRQISDTLREMADRVLEDVEAIHARMVGELERVRATADDSLTVAPGHDGPAAPARAEPEELAVPARAEPEELDVPDFVARG